MTSNSQGRGRLDALDRFIERVTHWADEAAALVCAFLIVVTTMSVIVYQQGITIAWLDDLLRALLIWLVYLGSVSLCFHNDHITMDALYLRFPATLRRALNVAIAILGFALCGYVSYVGLGSMMREFEYGMMLPAGYIPAWPQTLAIPLCFALMAVAYFSYLYAVIANRERPKPGTTEISEGP